MVEIRQTTWIQAPIERCFLLSLSIDLEMTVARGLRAVEGCTSGLIGPNECVTWEAYSFGFKVNHTSRITAYESPRFFQDTMVAGMFRSFHHDHLFYQDGEQTRMEDRMRFFAPFGLLGTTAEILVLRPYMNKLLRRRNHAIKIAAESDAWKAFLPSMNRPLQGR